MEYTSKSVVTHDPMAGWRRPRRRGSSRDSLLEALMGASLVVVDEELL